MIDLCLVFDWIISNDVERDQRGQYYFRFFLHCPKRYRDFPKCYDWFSLLLSSKEILHVLMCFAMASNYKVVRFS